MRLITTADENLYQAVFLAAKFGRAGKLVDPFQKAYEDEWDNPEVSFRYALALMATLHSIRTNVDGHRTTTWPWRPSATSCRPRRITGSPATAAPGCGRWCPAAQHLQDLRRA